MTQIQRLCFLMFCSEWMLADEKASPPRNSKMQVEKGLHSKSAASQVSKVFPSSKVTHPKICISPSDLE